MFKYAIEQLTISHNVFQSNAKTGKKEEAAESEMKRKDIFRAIKFLQSAKKEKEEIENG